MKPMIHIQKVPQITLAKTSAWTLNSYFLKILMQNAIERQRKFYSLVPIVYM